MLLIFLYVIFFIKSQIIFELVLKFILEVKVLQGDLLDGTLSFGSLLFVFV